MKIFAKGRSRAVVDPHTVVNSRMKDAWVTSLPKAAIEVKVSSTYLQLSGNFWLTITMTADELEELATTTTPHQLRARIERLQKKLAEMEAAKK